MGKNHFITSPPIIPELPSVVVTSKGDQVQTKQALPITRAVLLEAVKALKKVPGGAKRTEYALERACFHLQRVKIRRDEAEEGAQLPRGRNAEIWTKGAAEDEIRRLTKLLAGYRKFAERVMEK